MEDALAAVERERGKLAALEQARPAPLTDDERAALARLARDLPRLWNAPTTTDRDRKELLRTLVNDVIVTVHAADKRADLELCWEGGARTELTVRLNARGPESRRLPEDTVELIRRLAAYHPDDQIAAILARNGHRTGTGLAFTAARVRSARQRAGIPAAPPTDPTSQLVTINQAATELGASVFTIRRWLRDGLLPGEQVAPSAPWRIRLSDDIRAQFVPDIPDGYLSLADAAKALGCARQTVLHKVQRGELHAIHITRGRRKGLAINVPAPTMDQLITP